MRTEYPESFENIKYYLGVHEMGEQKREKIRDMVRKGRSLAFIVTSNFEIHIGQTGIHADIVADQSNLIEKGKIDGGSKKIVWVVSDRQMSHDISIADLTTLHAAIADKINEFLDLEYYLQSQR